MNHICSKLFTVAVTFGLSMRLMADGPTLNQTYAPPTYRGKVVLVVDKTVIADCKVAAKVDRLTQDLIGDGWRVLRHDVDRGPEVPFKFNYILSDLAPWAAENAYRVREIRAMIKSDYDADPGVVKNVFLIGHVPVPYSGSQSAYIDGGHFLGAFPADAFYGDMISPYGNLGWTDIAAVSDDTTWTGPDTSFQFDNQPGDGNFDQDYMPSPMQLGVGRLDLSRMDGLGVNEATLVSRYLDKDHDFRSAVLQVRRRAVFADAEGWSIDRSGSTVVFPNAIDFYDEQVNGPNAWLWFPFVSPPGDDYLEGEYASHGYVDSAFGIGYTSPNNANYPIGYNSYPVEGNDSDNNNNFTDDDSRVVFLNMSNSSMGTWDTENDFLKAPLANPYDPKNGRFGYALCTIFDKLGLDVATMTKRALGATIGEAIYDGFTGSVNQNLMGDPTLRLFNVMPPTALTITADISTANLSWTASGDSSIVGYNIYSAPTVNGPFTLVNTGGAVNGISYAATRPTAGSAGYVPDNFYMVRTVKAETTAVGNYLNMSDGVTVRVPGTSVPYLAILSQPANQYPTVGSGIANAVAFSVEAVGCDSGGDGQVAYQWFQNGAPISYSNPHITGANTRSILIKGVQASDAGTYSVQASIASAWVPASNPNVIMSSAAILSVNPTLPTANPDSFTIVRNSTTPIDLTVLANDTPGISGAALKLVSISALSDPSAGMIVINPDGQTIHFTPTVTRLEQISCTYIMTDGANFAQATVTINVEPIPGDNPPTIAPIADQQIQQDSGDNIQISVTDDNSPTVSLVAAVTSSNPNVQCWITQYGGVFTLHLAGNLPVNSAVVTLSFTDEDGHTSTLPINVTVFSATAGVNYPTMSAPTLSSTASGYLFSFNVGCLNGALANTSWAVYSSVDLTDWTPCGTVTFDGSGNAPPFSDNNLNGLMYKFYRLVNGGYTSEAIGYEQVTVPAATDSTHPGKALITDQLIQNMGSVNTLTSAFGQTTLPNGTQLQEWNGSAQVTYTYTTSGGWSGSATLNPGQGAWMYNPSSNPLTVTFVGLVPEGELSIPLGGNLVGSMVPQAGGIQSALGLNLNLGDVVTIWQSGASVAYLYDPLSLDPLGSPTGWYDGGGSTPMPEPIINVGEAFSFTPASGEALTTSYWDVGGDVPALSGGTLTSSSFAFNATGDANTSWTVSSSIDLKNWTPCGTLSLNSSGAGFFQDNNISSSTYKFYILSNGISTSQAIGFEQVTVTAAVDSTHPGSAPITDQLIQNVGSANTLTSVFGQTTLPNGTQIQEWNGGAQVTYTYTTSGGWSGSATLNPGQGAWMYNPSSNPLTVTFVGLVPEGELSIGLGSGANNLVGSMVPQAGGIQSALGLNLNLGDVVTIWQNGASVAYLYDPLSLDPAGSPTGWYDGSGSTPVPEPVVSVGEAFSVIPASGEIWIRSYSDK